MHYFNLDLTTVLVWSNCSINEPSRKLRPIFVFLLILDVFVGSPTDQKLPQKKNHLFKTWFLTFDRWDLLSDSVNRSLLWRAKKYFFFCPKWSVYNITFDGYNKQIWTVPLKERLSLQVLPLSTFNHSNMDHLNPIDNV